MTWQSKSAVPVVLTSARVPLSAKVRVCRADPRNGAGATDAGRPRCDAVKANAIGTAAGTQTQDEANESENENDGVNGSESESEKGGASAPIRTSRPRRQRVRTLTLQATARDAAEANASWIERTNAFDATPSAPMHDRSCPKR